MEIDWTFDSCDAADEREIERYWENVQLELDAKVAELADPVSHLRIAVEKVDRESPETDGRDGNARWSIHAALHLPGTTLVAQGQARSHEEAIDRLLAGLADRIDRWEEIPASVVVRREGLTGIAELLDGWRAEGRSEAFLSFLLPVAAGLGPYIERELQLRESDGTFVAAEVSAYDIIDEVLLQAWERFAAREKSLAIDLWLMKLADEAIGRLSSRLAEGSIDDDISPARSEPNELDRDEWEEWIERVAYRETLAMGELLPAERRIDTWDEADWEVTQAALAELFTGLPREQRQAVILSVVYGYSAAQIADFQGRAAADAETDVAAGIAAVRRNGHKHEDFDLEEALTRQQMRSERQRRNGR